MTGTNSFISGRSRYLLDGRRATVKHLVDADLLRTGDRMKFARPRKGVTYFAVVVEGGRIALDDGSVFDTPSKAAAAAAAAAAGMQSVDGWRAWMVESTMTTLDALRSRLLDDVAADAVAADSGTPVGGEQAELQPPQRTPHEFLKDARGRAEALRCFQWVT